MPTPCESKTAPRHPEGPPCGSESASSPRRRSTWDGWGGWSGVLAWLAGPVAILAVMAGVLAGRDQLAFRDVSHFYTPLYEYVADRQDAGSGQVADGPLRRGGFGWLTGNVAPQWNPLDLTGMPLAGETTTAVHYPIRQLVAAVRWDPFTAIGVYVTLHLLLASVAATWAARRFGIDPVAAGVAGVVYPLSGSVLFCAVNPPYLVSASWLPIALVGLISPLRRAGSGRDRRFCFGRRVTVSDHHVTRLGDALAAGVALAMMVLGGDPPTALHAGICALSVIALVTVASRLRVGARRRLDSSKVDEHVGRSRIPMPWWPLVSVLVATGLAAPQWAASLDWSCWSDRVGDTGRHDVFAYSVGPWRWLEVWLPDLYGTPWPVNERWDRWVFTGGRTDAVDALWTPTLYAGLVVPVAGVAVVWTSLRRWRRRRLTGDAPPRHAGDVSRWLSPLVITAAVLGVVAAMGSYGPLYPAMVQFFPGYDAFRYPSKWLPLFSFAGAMLAALWVHRSGRVFSNGRKSSAGTHEPTLAWWGRGRLRPALAGGLVVAFALVVASGVAVCVWRLGSLADSRVPRPSPDPWWGPLQTDAVVGSFLASAGHGVVLAAAMTLTVWMMTACVSGRLAACSGSLRFSNRDTGRRFCFGGRGWSWVWLLLILADLMVAHHDLVPTVRRDQVLRIANAWPTDRSPASGLPEDEARRWMRVVRRGGTPASWRQTSAPGRLAQVEAWARVSWWGRWHLADRQGLFNSITSIRPAAVGEYWNHVLPAAESMSEEQVQLFWRRCENWLGVDGRVWVSPEGIRRAITSPNAGNRSSSVGGKPADWRIRSGEATADSWDALVASWSRVDANAALVDSSAEGSRTLSPQEFGQSEEEGGPLVRLLEIGPNSGVWTVQTPRSVSVFRPVFQDGHWHGWIEPVGGSQGGPAPVAGHTVRLEHATSAAQAARPEADEQGRRPVVIRRAEFLGQAIDVPPGRWRLTVRYAPWWWRPATLVGVISWWVTLLVGAGMWLGTRRPIR